MRQATILWTAVCVTALAGVLVAEAQPQASVEVGATAQTTVGAESPPHDLLVTIAKGFHSGWGRENPRFSGADFVIRGPHAWAAFWAVHTGEPVPPPPVDFHRKVVLVAIQGPQPTAGGPNIAIVGLGLEGPFANVVIIDDERPGPGPEVTNPFHIVATSRELVPPRRSVSFQHLRPFPESGVVVGRVFAERPAGDPVPLPGAHVALLREHEEPRHAMTGLDGSYFFVNVDPGEYVLVAEHPGFEPAELPILVPPATLVAHNFVLTPRPPETGAFVGRVLGVRGNHHIPIPGALVRLFDPSGEVARTHTNREGRFAMHEVPPGVYRALAEAEGWLPAEAEVEIRAGEPTHHVFLLHRP